MIDAKTLQGVVDLVSRLAHDVNRLTARVEAIEGTADPDSITTAHGTFRAGDEVVCANDIGDEIRGRIDFLSAEHRLCTVWRGSLGHGGIEVDTLRHVADPEPEATAFLARPDIAELLRKAEQVPPPPASVPAPGFGVPRLREPVTVRPSAANAVGSVPRGMGGGIAFDGAHACTDDEEQLP